MSEVVSDKAASSLVSWRHVLTSGKQDVFKTGGCVPGHVQCLEKDRNTLR